MKKKDKEKAIELIKCCLIYRYSTEETLQHLEIHKIKMAERTLRRYKEEIENEGKLKTAEIAQQEMEEGLIHNIETIKEIQHQCWKWCHGAPTSRKIKLLSLLKNTTVSLGKFYRNLPSLEKMKKETESVKQKLDKLKITAQDSVASQAIQKTSYSRSKIYE